MKLTFITSVSILILFSCRRSTNKKTVDLQSLITGSKIIDTAVQNYRLPAVNINSIINFLDNNDDLEDSIIGYEGRQSGSYLNFCQIKRYATDSMLVLMTYKHNPKLRVYGMWALTERNPSLALFHLKRLQKDDATVMHRSGCTAMDTQVNYLIASRFDTSLVSIKPDKKSRYLKYHISVK